jgi:Leu/Phe-tRNA-protein transferase
LTRHLKERGFAFLDIKMPTKITLQLGARVIPRKDFLERMHEAQKRPVSFNPAQN